jgi:parvulin-like peptidyl-prolyl isomerase
MKKLLLLTVVFFGCLARDQKVPDDAFVIDTIGAVMFGQGGTEIITLSDVHRPSLTGVPQSQEDIIFERLVYLDAQKFKIAPDEEAVDKYLQEIQKQNNLTLDELKQIFRQAGYSYEEGRDQFKRLQTVKSLLDYKIHSNLIVPRQEIELYYKNNPVTKEDEYTLEYALVPFKGDKQDLREDLVEFVTKQKAGSKKTQNDADLGLVWNEPFTMKKSEIADDKAFIYDMKVGTVSAPRETEGGFELYRLVEKKDECIASLEDRYQEIVRTLTQPKYEKLMSDYKKQLFDSVSIVYF